MKDIFMQLLNMANGFGNLTKAQMYNEKNSQVEFEFNGKKVSVWVDVIEENNDEN